MPVNNGIVEETYDDNNAWVRVYYDRNWLIDNPDADLNLAPLIDGPPAPDGKRYCYYVKNATGSKVSATVLFSTGQLFTFDIQRGDPVTSGPTGGRSRTAAQLAALGITKRGDIDTISIGG